MGDCNLLYEIRCICYSIYIHIGTTEPKARVFTHGYVYPQISHLVAKMTLNKDDKLRSMDKRRGSVPFPMNLPNVHRRSMPVDERDLRATSTAPQSDELSKLLRCASYSPSEQHRGSCASDSSDSVISTGSEADSQVYKVVLLGEHGVGKSSLARVFGGVEDGGHDCDEAGEDEDESPTHTHTETLTGLLWCDHPYLAFWIQNRERKKSFYF